MAISAPDISRIVSTTCDVLHVDPANLPTKTKVKRSVLAKHLICYFLRKHTDMSFADIAEVVLANRGAHSTAAEALKRLNQQLDGTVLVGRTKRTRMEWLMAVDAKLKERPK